MNKKVLTLCAGRSAGRRFNGIHGERFERRQ